MAGALVGPAQYYVVSHKKPNEWVWIHILLSHLLTLRIFLFVLYSRVETSLNRIIIKNMKNVTNTDEIIFSIKWSLFTFVR